MLSVPVSSIVKALLAKWGLFFYSGLDKFISHLLFLDPLSLSVDSNSYPD
jgi:hypothetical protein